MELITTFLCMKKDIGIHNNLFGGILLAKLDEAAAALATQICDTPNMVTLKMEEVIFKKPVKIGNLIKIYGNVEKIGKSSVTLNIEARKHSVYTGNEDLVCSTKIIFVRIDEDGNSIPISDKVREKFVF